MFEHINKFLEVVGLIKINGVSQDRFRLSILPISLAGATSEWFKNDCIGPLTAWEDLVEKSVQEFYQSSYDNEEIDAGEDDDPDDIADIFKIKGIGTYKEYELNNHVTRDLEGSWLDKGVPYQLCLSKLLFKFENAQLPWDDLDLPRLYYTRKDQQIRRIHQLDTTYRPFYSEQRIDVYSLNNVSVLPDNTVHYV
ncbi:hypothetical protein Tco_1094023 [Tanacetum coccineum]|uniref:Uncharacterized protein n=1 Tax=Tanacetum coccineum TaxID=301880 RepID=A0ABQ5IFL3_9ASTR